jgi:indole-3-glycerol phosphate synthase/phosphoribosylanthranilate isomerase
VSVLDRIVARTRADLRVRKATKSLRLLEAVAKPSDRSLEEALRAPRTGFVLECKKASPSRGLLRPDFDPVALARSYAWGADAISVLTDAPHFQGDHAFLRPVRQAAPVPVLCKDFVTEPYQVVEARVHGADAVLLMLSVLDDEAYRACAAAAERLRVDALTEVHDQAELERAIALGAKIVGINNRDLTSLEVDLTTTERLAPQVPADRVVVAESGVFTHGDVRRLRPHADAFLVGTSLVLADDVDRAARELIAGRFKVCGLTRPADAAAAWAAGATWGGVIFAPESPRCVTAEVAAQVQAGAPLAWVGVFVNEEPDRVVERATSLGLSAVQLHGEEPPEQVASLRERLPHACEVWKAARVAEGIPAPAEACLEAGADRLLLDAFRPGQRGGTGERFDWALFAAHPQRERFVLSGGLAPENAAEADALGAWALDVNSGVEDAPGLKSAERLAAFGRALRGLGRSQP